MGSDDWEAAEIQMCVDLVGDTFDAVAGYMFCKDKQMQVYYMGLDKWIDAKRNTWYHTQGQG